MTKATELASPTNAAAEVLAVTGTLTVEEVAAFLRVDRKTVYAAVARNQIPHRRIGQRIRFHREALALWLQGTCKRSSESGVR